MQLPDALRPLAAYAQFVPYATWPDPDKPGKTKKAVTHRDNGKVCSPFDRTNWSAPSETARGFVLDAADPFFFLDIDDALLPDGTWSQVAQDLCARFAGCAVEVSQSGRGLHIIGTGTCPPHGCDSTALGAQFYTERRFIALTGTHATGDAAHDATAALQWLVSTHFPPVSEGGLEWSEEGPREGWRGPTDDDDLIRRALASRSTAALFGGSAAFADLWHGETDALAKHFPGEREPVDASAADAALASHLAFWTGCDMPRIERLMRRSALAREKWDGRPDYLPRTILRVCPPGRAVCQDKLPEPAAVAEGAVEPERAPDAPPRPPRGAVLDGEAMRHLFHGCVYLRQQHRAYVPGVGVLKPEAFNVVFGGYKFLMTEGTEGAGAIKSEAFTAFTQSSRYQGVHADLPAFEPRRPSGEVFEQDGKVVVNTYAAPTLRRRDGDAGPFLAHLQRLLPDERDRGILIAWMAGVVQYPGVKFLWSPVVVGGKGDGKSALFDKFLSAAVGEQFTNVVKPAQMVGKHATWMLNVIFTLCDDVGKHTTEEWLDDVKTLITGRRQLVEPKGVDTFMSRVCTNIAFTSNHKRGIRSSADERRFAQLWCASPSPAETAAFMQWSDDPANVEAVSGYLASYAIPDALNPALVMNAPRTSATEAAAEGGADRIDQMLEDAVAEGAQGFRGGLVTMQAFQALLDGAGLRGISRTARIDCLERCGYVPHPAAGARGDGWTDNGIKEAGGKRLRVFVKRGSLAAQLETAPAVAAHLSKHYSPPLEFGNAA